MKGKRENINITLWGEIRSVEAVVFGPLAMYPFIEKVRYKGRMINAYVITHVRTGLKVMTVCGCDKAREVIMALLDSDIEWDFFTGEAFLKDKLSVKAAMDIMNKFWRTQSRHEKRTLNTIQDKLNAESGRNKAVNK